MYDCLYTTDPLASTTIGFTCTASSTPIATSSDIVVLPTMSAGEVLVAFLLFCTIMIELTRLVLASLDRVALKKSYLGYSGGDVEIRNDI